MINISNYILEKLHLTKDSDIGNIHDTVIDKICIMCNVDDMSLERKYKSTEVIKKWVEENDVTDFTGYTDWLDLKHISIPDDIIKMFTGDSRDMQKYIDELKSKEHSVEKLTPFSLFYFNNDILILTNISKDKNIDRVFVKQ